MVNAEGGTRTPTGCPIRPSNVRVYQFHHFGTSEKVIKRRARKRATSLAGYFFGASLLGTTGALGCCFLPASALPDLAPAAF